MSTPELPDSYWLSHDASVLEPRLEPHMEPRTSVTEPCTPRASVTEPRTSIMEPRPSVMEPCTPRASVMEPCTPRASVMEPRTSVMEPIVKSPTGKYVPLQWWFATDPRDALRSVPQEPQGKVVYVSGIFDLFHPGYVAFLYKALAAGGDGSILLVGVTTDQDAISQGHKPIMTHAERTTMLRSCRPVTQVVARPPILTAEFLDQYGIGLVVHVGDDSPTGFYAVPRARGILQHVPCTPGISTADIIERIRRG